MSGIRSKRVTAEALEVAEKTVARHSRIMAAVLMISRKLRSVASLKRVHEHLQQSALTEGCDFKPVAFVVKQRYDGVSLRLNIAEAVNVDMRDNTQSTKCRTAIAKLLHTATSYHALWKVDKQYVSLVFSCPGLVQSLEKNTAEWQLEGLTTSMGDLSWAQTVFAHLLRVAVCDDAAMNEKTDLAMFMKQSFLKLLRFLCELHKEHKIAELQFSAFPVEKNRHGAFHIVFRIWRRLGSFQESYEKPSSSKVGAETIW